MIEPIGEIGSTVSRAWLRRSRILIATRSFEGIPKLRQERHAAPKGLVSGGDGGNYKYFVPPGPFCSDATS